MATIDLTESDEEFAQTADVMVNAAGLDGFQRFTDITFEEWSKVVDVNLNGVFNCVQAALPDMIDGGLGTDRQHLVVQRNHSEGSAMCRRRPTRRRSAA